MPDGALFLLLLTAALVWLWLDGLKVHELACASAAELCERQNLQLLDATVSLCRIRLGRNAAGQVVPRRTYTFEYSLDGDSRSQGFVVLLGHRVEAVGL